MTDQITYAYAGDIVKSQDDDGRFLVYGKATGPDLDLDQQICDPTWLRTAMPEWMKFGNIREMHQPIAAGVGIELAAEGDDWMLKSEVIDQNTRRKVETGVLKGYSVGIRNAKVVKDANAPGGRIVAGTIVEVSLVDRPANPTALAGIAKAFGAEGLSAVEGDLEKGDSDAKATWDPEATYQPENPEFYENTNPCPNCDGLGKLPETGETCPTCDGSGHAEEQLEGDQAASDPAIEREEDPKAADAELSKREFTEGQREAAAEEGAALPDGSFPIRTVADLRNAIKAFGRAKDPEAAKAHIKRRAEALGKADLLPESWKAAEGDLEKGIHSAAELATIRASLIELIKAELDEMANGEEDEIADISELLAALQLFICWWEEEAEEGETDQPYMETETDEHQESDDMAYVALGVSADLIKTATAGDPAAQADLKIEILKALGLEDIETAKAAQAEELTMLKAELERVKELAAPGGPAITRTSAQAFKSAEAERMEADAARYRHIAKSVADPAMAQAYLEKAIAMEHNARQIAGA